MCMSVAFVVVHEAPTRELRAVLPGFQLRSEHASRAPTIKGRVLLAVLVEPRLGARLGMGMRICSYR